MLKILTVVLERQTCLTKVMNSLFNKIANVRGVSVIGGVGDLTESMRGASALKKTQQIKPEIKDLQRFVAFQDNEGLGNIISDAINALGAVTAAEETTERK